MQTELLETVFRSETIDTAALPSSAITHEVKRVALFAEAFLPKVDGVTRTVLLTIKYLEATGREVMIIAPAPTFSHISCTPIYGVPSLWLPFAPETRVAPPYPPVLPAIRNFAPDIIHLFSPFSLGATGMIAGDCLGIPVVANYQSDLPAYTRSYGFGFLRSTFVGALRWIHNGCTLNLAPTHETLRTLHEWKVKRLRLWGRGVDAVRFNPARRDADWRTRLLNGRSTDRLLALYVGRMAKDKHLETLLDVAHTPGVALTLVGNGTYLAPLQRLFADTDAYFAGSLLGEELANAYAAADVFVFPGPEETFGQVVFEAMASGLPVVVTDRGGPATLICDGVEGFICQADDSAAFAQRVSTLRDDPDLRQRMSRAARCTAEQHPWLEVMQQLEGHYAEALRLHRRLQRSRVR